MKEKEEVLIGILLFIIIFIAAVSSIIERKTRNPTTRKQKILHKVCKCIFWISFILVEPCVALIFILFKTDKGFDFLCSLAGILGNTRSSSSTSYYENKQRKTTDTENDSEYEKMYYHYDENYTSSIYDNTVIRSDGVSGYRSGDFIYYNDNSMGHILDEDNGIIEKWK